MMTSVKYPSCRAQINEKGSGCPIASPSLTRLQVIRYNPSQFSVIESPGQLEGVCREEGIFFRNKRTKGGLSLTLNSIVCPAYVLKLSPVSSASPPPPVTMSKDSQAKRILASSLKTPPPLEWFSLDGDSVAAAAAAAGENSSWL